MRTDVSALYVDPRGPYPKLVADWWDEKRDARDYAGPNPVVAHPPCGPWGSLARYANPATKELAFHALVHLQRFGGVLEHPARSGFFAAARLPLPLTEGDGIGFTVQVDQVNWGHVARKRTWLYCVGIPRAFVAAGIRFGAEPTHWISGSRKLRTTGGVCPPHIKFCSNQQRRRTPVAFAEWLVELASQARGNAQRSA